MRYGQMTIQDALKIKYLNDKKCKLNKRFDEIKSLCQLKEKQYQEARERNKRVGFAYNEYHEAIKVRAKVLGDLQRVKAKLVGHMGYHGLSCIEEAYQLLEAKEVSNG